MCPGALVVDLRPVLPVGTSEIEYLAEGAKPVYLFVPDKRPASRGGDLDMRALRGDSGTRTTI